MGKDSIKIILTKAIHNGLYITYYGLKIYTKKINIILHVNC